MICTKEELKYYLEEDRKVYHKEDIGLKNKISSLVFKDYNYEYIGTMSRKSTS